MLTIYVTVRSHNFDAAKHICSFFDLDILYLGFTAPSLWTAERFKLRIICLQFSDPGNS